MSKENVISFEGTNTMIFYYFTFIILYLYYLFSSRFHNISLNKITYFYYRVVTAKIKINSVIYENIFM